jgi:Fe-S oxidoreductase
LRSRSLKRDDNLKILLTALNSKFIHTNLALRYIKSYCSGFDITLREYTINDQIDRVLRDIYGYKADVICFSCYIWNIDMVLKVCSSLKKADPHIVTVLGGPEVSFDSIEIMGSFSFIDYIIKGEGEESSRQLFRFLESKEGDLQSIGGLVYRDEGRVFENECSELIKDLSIIPFPYTDKDKDLKNRILYYEASRGCPFNCSYCLSSTIRGVRFLHLDRVKSDLKWFIDNNIDLVKFVDRTFNCNKNYMEILKFLVDNKKNTRFHFEISADILKESEVEFLRNVPPGLFQFEAGVQSTNRDTLKFIDRNADITKINNNIKSIRENDNVQLHLDLIAGLPGENYESFSKSFDDVYALKPHMLQLGFLKLLKGSRMREESNKYGIVFNYYTPYEVIKTDSLSFDGLLKLKAVEEVVDRYYNSGRFRCSMLCMERLFDSPFSMFESLGAYKTETGEADNVSNTGQYRLLYDFYISMGFKDPDFFRQCLAFDYILQGRNMALPDFLRSDKAIEKKAIWDFLSDTGNIEKYLYSHRGESVKNIIKDILTHNFTYDIPVFFKEGKIIRKDALVMFDYSTRDPYGRASYFTADESI